MRTLERPVLKLVELLHNANKAFLMLLQMGERPHVHKRNLDGAIARALARSLAYSNIEDRLLMVGSLEEFDEHLG